jgi:hypothetical protein
MEGAARAISDLLIRICTDAGPAERRRLGRLLTTVCQEAAAAAKRTGAAA